ncbi:MAG: DUF3592 domain-containing protein [Candidatus Omnitrophica bacterium]|nr:DUF3592 domain-containing protein [Candidatus Omnitrophota bacterium]MCB9721936.1 DUF3592 domain-containing protein [Candidatus Omnitrophota bacterium]
MSRKAPTIPIRPLVSGAVVISVCVYFIVICAAGLDKEYVEHGWPQTSGTVLNPDAKLDGKKNADRVHEGYEQTINYEYTVGDRRLQSNSVSPELFVDKDNFPEGQTIAVWYNPDDISESVLIRRKTQKQYLWGMILFCAGVVVFTVFNVFNDIRHARE